MKKILATIVLTAFFTTIFSGCVPFWEKEPFDFNYKLSDESVAYFTQNDDAQMLSCGNPLYAGAQPLPFKGARDYEKARAEKTKYIITQSDKLVEVINDTSGDFDKLRAALMVYFDVVLKEKKEYGAFVRDAFLMVSKLKTARVTANALYTTLRSSSPSNTFAKAYFDYQAVSQALEYSSLTLKDMEWIMRYSALTIQEFEGADNQALTEAAKQLDAVMSDDTIRNKLVKVTEEFRKITYALNQLESADYYFSVAASDFIEASLPALKEKALNIKSVDDKDIAPKFVGEYLNCFEDFNNAIKTQLEQYDKKNVIAVEDSSKGNVAYAMNGDGYNWYERSKKVLSKPEEKAPPTEGYLTKGWGYVKTAAGAVKTGIGVGVDILNIAANNVNSLGLGIYYGNTIEEIDEHMQQGYKQAVDNYNKNMSGSQTLKTATGYFNSAEELGGDIGAGAVESTLGKGYTSWAIGGITKLTVGMFTGLGKGITMVSNTQATAGETVEGAINIGFSFIGGSKVLINSGTAKLAGQTTGEAAKKVGMDGIYYLGEKAFKADATKIMKQSAEILAKNKITAAEAEKLISNSLSLEANNIIRAEIAANRVKMAEEFAKILKEGGSKALESAKMDIKKELIEKLGFTFEKNISGIMEAIKVNLGGDLSGYANNLVGSWIDNGLSSIISGYVNAIAETITIDDIVGTFPGTMVITDVYINEALLEAKTPAGSGLTDGCDIGAIMEQIKAIKGKSNPINIVIEKTGDYTGLMVFDSSQPSQKMEFTFADGKISCEGKQDDAIIKIDLTASRVENKILLAGSGVINYKSDMMRITLDIKGEK